MRLWRFLGRLEIPSTFQSTQLLNSLSSGQVGSCIMISGQQFLRFMNSKTSVGSGKPLGELNRILTVEPSLISVLTSKMESFAFIGKSVSKSLT